MKFCFIITTSGSKTNYGNINWRNKRLLISKYEDENLNM